MHAGAQKNATNWAEVCRNGKNRALLLPRYYESTRKGKILNKKGKRVLLRQGEQRRRKKPK